MPQILQHMPSAPMGQAFILSARLKAVPTPISSARMSIACAAGSMLRSSVVRIFLAIAKFSLGGVRF
jgi:hypothetical protein